jgi:hypothetical protein
MAPDSQRQLIREFEPDSPWIRRLGDLISREQRTLVHDIQINIQMGLMARLAVLHCYDEEKAATDFGDSFVRALLAVNELHGATLYRPEYGIDAAAFVATEVQSMLTVDEGLLHILYRQDRFFEWASGLPSDDRDVLPISDDLKRFTELDFGAGENTLRTVD